MKREADLIRKVLLALEAKPSVYAAPLEIDGVEPTLVSYHVMLLCEAEFVAAIDASSLDGIDWYPERLTYQGHELLDSIRDEGIWHETKSIAKTAGTTSIKMLFEIALDLGKKKLLGLGLHF